MLNRLTIAQRLAVMACLTIVVMLATTTVNLYGKKSELINEHKHRLQSVVDVGYSLVASYHERARQGELSAEQARQQALAAVATLRYEGNEYFWVNDMDARMLMHGVKPALNGKALIDLKDSQGKRIFADFIRIVESSQQGFSDYFWPRAGSDQPIAKLSYVKGFAPWGWVIGSGVYIDDVDAQFRQLLWRDGVVLVSMVLVLAVLSLTVGRSIVTPLQSTTRAMQDVAHGEGDLTVRLDERGVDEMAQLSAGFNQFSHKVGQVIGQVNAFGDRLQTSAGHLASVTDNSRQSLLAHQQETQQVATSANELNTRINDVAGNAADAAQRVQSVRQQAVVGQQVVSHSIEAMTSLASSVSDASATVLQLEQEAQNIGAILDVIRAIAEQTNLLALNAAIEAARAGDHGRGFAVVADEVRTLAQRTQQSTEEIQQMIESLQRGSRETVAIIDQGRQLAENSLGKTRESGEMFDEIVRDILEAASVNEQIAAVTGQQSEVVAMISTSATNLSDSFDGSAHDANAIAEASQQLNNLAQEMRRLLAQFKV